MPTYKNPGVYVSESPLVSNSQRSNLSTATAVFFGTAIRGPLTATLIDSWSSYKSYYGDIDPNHELGYAVYHYFANGGRQAYVVRVLHSSGSGTLASAASVNVTYTADGSASAPVYTTLFNATAANKGAWGNNLKVRTYAGTPSVGASVSPVPLGGASATWYGFDLSVLLDDVEVERWNNVSANQADNRFVKTVVNTYSKYITIPTTSWPVASVGSAPKTDAAFTLAGGIEGVNEGGAVYSDNDFTAAIGSQLDSIEGVLLLNAVGRTSNTVVTALNTLAVSRGNAFVVVDAATTDDYAAATSLVSSYPQSSYVSVYYPKLQMVDPTKTGPGALRDTFPGGAILGAYSRVDSTRGVAKAPAGYDVDIRNAVGLVTNYSTTNTETMYSTYGINLLKSIPGGGIIINGARTLDKSTPGRYIPIRRSLNYLKQALSDATEFAVFEPNDERLWTRITMTVSSLLSEFWRSGGLKGANANQAFYVTCNSTNNTSTTINNGEVHIEVGVALQYPAEFIVINLSQWTGGSNAVSTL